MFQEELCRKKAEELVGKMTLEEKASQLKYDAPAIPRLNIAAYNWWNEALHGVARAGTATVFPQAIAFGAMFDRKLLQKVADAIATEGRAKYNESKKQGDHGIYKGINFWAPNINIFRDPRWGRGHETYGEDPYLSAELGKAFVRGLQGEGTHMKAAACVKHFAVHSGPEELRHEFDAKVTDRDLWETYLYAFEECVKNAGVEAVMGAYNRTNGEPCCGSYFLLRDVLRGKWKFKGHVVSDCWAIRDFHTHHMVTVHPQDSAALALKAGCDLNCGNTYLYIIKAYEEGKVTEEEITEAAIRLFTTRFKLGIETESEYDTIPYEKVECREHLELAKEAAEKGSVLLKNDGLLPLKKEEIKTIGVIGPNADSRKALMGNYYGTSSHYVTLLEGIQNQAESECRILYAKGAELNADRTEPLAESEDRLAEAVSVAQHSDVVVLCLGLDETLEGEEGDDGNQYASGDKKDLKLPESQMNLLKAMVRTKKPIVLCLLAGSSIDLSYAQEYCNAILLGWYPGAQGGNVLAEILFGKRAPGGKLPVTFYKDTSDLPAFIDYAMKNRTYRYYQGTPLYPFGYGLTYGEVDIIDATILETKQPCVHITIENAGNVRVQEVIEIYGKNLDAENVPDHPVLCGFERVSLEAKETKEIEVSFEKRLLYPVAENGERLQKGKNAVLYVGTSQPDERSVELTKKHPIEVLYSL